MWTKELQFNPNKKPEIIKNNFQGLNIYSSPGVHEQAFSFFQALNLDKNVSICILGAGAGAFDERLYLAGYKNITALEFYPEVYKSKGKLISNIDLNEDFSQIGKFDVVVALDIIEHLENQFHFLRQIKSILKGNGYLIINTPNPASTYSRFKFFYVGYLSCFNPSDVAHINPIFDHIFKNYLAILKMQIKKTGSLNVWKLSVYEKGFLQKIGSKAIFLITRIMKNKDDRGTLLYLIKNEDNHEK
jgi:SAM-dependent methyltransferase